MGYLHQYLSWYCCYLEIETWSFLWRWLRNIRRTYPLIRWRHTIGCRHSSSAHWRRLCSRDSSWRCSWGTLLPQPGKLQRTGRLSRHHTRSLFRLTYGTPEIRWDFVITLLYDMVTLNAESETSFASYKYNVIAEPHKFRVPLYILFGADMDSTNHYRQD